VQQAYKGVLDATGSGPAMIGAGVSALGAKAMEYLRDPDLAHALQVTEGGTTPDEGNTPAPPTGLETAFIKGAFGMADASQRMHQAAEDVSGVGKAETPFQNAANALGQNFVPGSLPFTVGMAGADLWNRYFPNALPHAVSKGMEAVVGVPAVNAAEEQKYNTNALLAIGAIRGVTHTMPDGQVVTLPGITETGRALTDEEAVNYWTNGAAHPQVVLDKVRMALPRIADAAQLARSMTRSLTLRAGRIASSVKT
jgi:hypothetical protein